MDNFPRVVLHDASAGAWQSFACPCEIVETCRHDEVMPCLRRVDHLVQSQGLHAAGFISYEAAPAFDRALSVREASGFPLLWFGLFPAVEMIVLPSFDSTRLMLDAPWQPSVTADEYAHVIARLRDAIAAGETYQVNYTFRLKQPANRDPWNLFRNLVAAQPPPYAAYIETDRYAICSASPELFFDLDGPRIASRPMKGTIARGRWQEEDLARARELAASEKNRAENAMIVDMMRNDLGRIARVGSVQVSDLFRVERYPTLWQMTSCISAETSAGLAEIFAATFPCASITGAPKASTMRIIAQNETEPRRIYTGSIGWIAPGRRAQFNVAIRTVLIDKARREAEYGVGGGVVWDSTPQGEYEECLLKARILRTRQPEFSLLESLLWTPDGGYFCLSEHLRRLRDSAEYFGFPRCDETAAIELAALAARLPAAPHKIRLLVARDGKISSQSEPIRDEEFSDPVRLELAAEPIDASDVFLYHKTTHREVYATARTGCREGDDVLLYNQRGDITETIRGNIVVRCGRDLWTPPVPCGLLAGTYRAQLLAEGKIYERVVPLEMLPKCDELIFINSVRLWRQARLVGPRDAQSLAAGLRAKAR
ncbi:MAG: aminodeoxychorismate synthase component I [Thermoguttaceae bacterium]